MRQHKDRTSAVSSIKTRTAYQVGVKLFKTIRSAARHEAWRLILDKYCYDYYEDCNTWRIPKLSDIKHLRGMVCECSDESGSEACEIHSRYNGYFHRVHKRLSAAIEKRYAADVSARDAHDRREIEG